MATEMIACPFCGSAKRLSVFIDLSGQRGKVICKCGVEGAAVSLTPSQVKALIEERAIELWNTRASGSDETEPETTPTEPETNVENEAEEGT
jgi:transcription elongation factor Elf1